MAVGYEDSPEVIASAGRDIKQEILFRVAVSIAGCRCVALIDS